MIQINSTFSNIQNVAQQSDTTHILNGNQNIKNFIPDMSSITGSGNTGMTSASYLIRKYWGQQEVSLVPVITYNWYDCNCFANQKIVDFALSKPIDMAFRQINIIHPDLTEKESQKLNTFINSYGFKPLKEQIKTWLKTAYIYGTAALVIHDGRPLSEELQQCSYDKLSFSTASWWELLPMQFGSFSDWENIQTKIVAAASSGKESSDTNWAWHFQNSEYFYYNDPAYRTVEKVHKSRVYWFKNDAKHKNFQHRALQGKGVSIFEDTANILVQTMNFFHGIMPQTYTKLRTEVFSFDRQMYSDNEERSWNAEMNDLLKNYSKHPDRSVFLLGSGTTLHNLNFDAQNLKIVSEMVMQVFSAFFFASDRGFWAEEQKSHTSEVEAINKQERNLDYVRKPIEPSLLRLVQNVLIPAITNCKKIDDLAPVKIEYYKKEPSFAEKVQKLQAESTALLQGIEKNAVSIAEYRQFLQDKNLLTYDANVNAIVDNPQPKLKDKQNDETSK